MLIQSRTVVPLNDSKQRTFPLHNHGQNECDDTNTVDFCNVRSPEILHLVAQLKKPDHSEREFVKAAFYWVRDNIKYCFLPDWTVPVEYTLETREGQCGTKSCLLVTILRAAGLEAGFYVVKPFDTGRKMFIFPKWIRSILSHTGVHFLIGVKLDGHWTKLDPSFDKRLSLGIQNVCPDRSYLATFDGFHDALITDEFYDDLGDIPIENIDCYMRKKHRVPAIVHKCMNVCTDYIRDSSRRNAKVEDLLVEMEEILAKQYKLDESVVASSIS